MVVEGIDALPAVVGLSLKCEVEMPIMPALDDVIHHKREPKEAVELLMGTCQ